MDFRKFDQHTILSEPYDIFAKYMIGANTPNFPFKFYHEQKTQQIQTLLQKTTKFFKRGPYRRYNAEEKYDLIQRILHGESLQKIAEETQIPKRNLIRWKSQFLQNKKILKNKSSFELKIQHTTSQRPSTQLATTKQQISNDEYSQFYD